MPSQVTPAQKENFDRTLALVPVWFRYMQRRDNMTNYYKFRAYTRSGDYAYGADLHEALWRLKKLYGHALDEVAGVVEHINIGECTVPRDEIETVWNKC